MTNKILTLLAVCLIAATGFTATAQADGCSEYNASMTLQCNVFIVDEIPASLLPVAFPAVYQGTDNAVCAYLSTQQLVCQLTGPVAVDAPAPDQYIDSAGNTCRNVRNDAGEIVDITCVGPTSLPVSVPVPAFTG